MFLWWTKYVVFISIWSINEACGIYFRFSGVGLNHKHLKPFWDTSSLLHVNVLEFLCKQVPHRQWGPHLWPVIVLGGLITEPVLQLVGVAQTSVCFLGLNVMPDNGPFPSYNSNHYFGRLHFTMNLSCVGAGYIHDYNFIQRFSVTLQVTVVQSVEI